LPVFTNNPSPAPNPIFRRDFNNLSGSQASIGRSDRISPSPNSQANQTQTNISFDKTSSQFNKPLSALQITQNGSASGDPSRLRSSSASQFSLPY